MDDGAIFRISLLSRTPTRPKSVTVHFRYFNDNCEDILDFLVVVTCNDTLLFDPFNFVIPFTNGENTRSPSDRSWPERHSAPDPGCSVGFWPLRDHGGCQRHDVDMDDDPEILFPFE